MTEPPRHVLLVALVVVLFLTAGVGSVVGQSAPDCSNVNYNGDGTDANPYEAGNVDQLQCINSQGLGANYVQVSDIDASSTSGWNNGAGFEPIGGASSSGTPFSGTFDGGGHEITDLSVNRQTENNVGLFADVGTSGTVTSAYVAGATVAGDSKVGGLIGLNAGTVERSSATGDVSGDVEVGGLIGDNAGLGTVTGSHANSSVSGTDVVGGLVGDISGGAPVENSSATGDVSGTDVVGGLIGDNSDFVTGSHANSSVSGASLVGGLAGENSGTVRESYATGNISGGVTVGGLVGLNSVGTVKLSYANGSVSGTSYVGGLLGQNGAGVAFGDTVENSYAAGDVSGNSEVGGLVGGNLIGSEVTESYATGNVSGDLSVGGLIGENNATVRESYAIGDVSGNNNVGGLVGLNVSGNSNVGSLVVRNAGIGEFNPVTVENSYWDTETTGQPDSDGGTGLTTSEMTGSAATNNMIGFDFQNTWETVTNPDDYPILAFQTEDDPAPANFEVSIDSTNSPVEEGDTVTVTGTVENTGDESDTQTITATVPGIGSMTETVNLDGGESRTETFSAPTPPGSAGTYTLTVESEDDTATETIVVEPPGDFEVTVDSTNSPVTEGETLSVTATVQNTGNQQDTQQLSLVVGGTVRDSTDVTLTGGDSTTETLEWSTVSGDAGTYTAVVETEDDNDTTTVDVESDGGDDIFPDPLPGFNSPPTNTQEIDNTLYEDINGDGDGTDPTQAVNLWTQLVINEQSFDDLTQQQIDALDWNGDGQLTPADAVSLWTEQVLA